MTTATQVQYRRNTALGQASFVGAVGEATIDTTNWCWRIHDGVTAGGFVQASKTYVDAQVAAVPAAAGSSLFLWNVST